jgi:hypothetical protein
LPNGVEAWSVSPSKYVQETVKNDEEYIKKTFNGRTLLKRAPTPFENDYAPELDTTPELDATKANYYQSQIGDLCWMVELGHYRDVVANFADSDAERRASRRNAANVCVSQDQAQFKNGV